MATIYGPQTYEEALDTAVRLATSWRSFAEAKAELTKPGATYVPTLYDDFGPEELRVAVRLIRQAFDQQRLPWWDGAHHNPRTTSPKARTAELDCPMCGITLKVSDRFPQHDIGRDPKSGTCSASGQAVSPRTVEQSGHVTRPRKAVA